MKPSFDLKDPIVKLAIEDYSSLCLKALAVEQSVERAVLPIYAAPERSNKPQQIGSGVAVFIKGEYFIFSASHVFDNTGEYQVLVGLGDGTALSGLSGDRFSTKRGPSGTHQDDPIDASVFHIQDEIPLKLQEVALSSEDLDVSNSGTQGSIYLIAGFRSKKSFTVQNNANTKREAYPSMEYDHKNYSLLGIDNNFHLALAYENQVVVDKRWQTSPTPKGMSGGAIIRIEGEKITPPMRFPKSRQLLSAITIERHKGTKKNPGVLIGTRIGVHLGLINQFLPELLD